MHKIYVKLAEHLDNLPEGFPKTESGVELKILKKLFTLREAEIALSLQMKPETVASISTRTPTYEVAPLSSILEQMSKKGLIFRINKNGEKLYMAAQFVIGIWEYHVNDLDKELVEYFNEYIPFLSKKMLNSHKTKQLRVIPISGSLSTQASVMFYEKAEEIIRQQTKIVVATCICRKEHKLRGKLCQYPFETCLVFNKGAEFYKENNIGQIISTDKALDILKKGAELGLVLQVSNSQKPTNICMCCSCCCQVLKNIKKQNSPSQIVNSGWHAYIDESICITCGTCVDTCHMNAIKTIDSNTTSIDLNRCIGCGVCSIRCELNAVKLVKKEANELWLPPKNTFETYFNIAKERGLVN